MWFQSVEFNGIVTCTTTGVLWVSSSACLCFFKSFPALFTASFPMVQFISLCRIILATSRLSFQERTDIDQCANFPSLPIFTCLHIVDTRGGVAD